MSVEAQPAAATAIGPARSEDLCSVTPGISLCTNSFCLCFVTSKNNFPTGLLPVQTDKEPNVHNIV